MNNEHKMAMAMTLPVLPVLPGAYCEQGVA